MNKFIHAMAAVAAIALMLAWSMPASAAAPTTAPGQNKLQCFDGASEGTVFGGDCTIKGKGAKGTATLDLTDNDPQGDFAGVFTADSNLYGMPVADITQMSYHYTASIDPQPGNLSYNIPIDTNGDGDTEFFLFVDAFYCPGDNGIVDIVNDPDCGMWEGGSVFYVNWDAFVAAHPTAKVALDNFVFIVAERTPVEPAAQYTVSNVKFGKPGK
jgi:hypothetical protein